MLESALTALAVVLALTQPVPQIVRLLRTRSTAGVSGPTAWLGVTINLGWVAYGIGQGLLPVIVLSGAYVVGYVLVAGLLVRGGNRRGIPVAVAAAIALTTLTLVAGWLVLGTVLALTVAVQFLPQVIEAWRSDDLTALAPGTYVVCGIDGLVWGGYGALVADVPLVLYGAVMVSVAVAVLVPRRRWSRRMSIHGPPGVPA